MELSLFEEKFEASYLAAPSRARLRKSSDYIPITKVAARQLSRRFYPFGLRPRSMYFLQRQKCARFLLFIVPLIAGQVRQETQKSQNVFLPHPTYARKLFTPLF